MLLTLTEYNRRANAFGANVCNYNSYRVCVLVVLTSLFIPYTK